jgi:hypothetical protein
MKLYHIKPKSYGDEFFVMSKSLEKAKEAILKHILNSEDYADYYADEFDYYKKGFAKNVLEDHLIEEYSEDQVVESEIA